VTIGVLHIELLIPGSHSLKEKRRVVKSLKQQIHNRYNCSVAEIGEKDLWARATLAACVIGDDTRFVNAQLNEIARFAAQKNGAELLDYHIEML
jgi:uncharacterized protein YlxP (DUF503 family)